MDTTFTASAVVDSAEKFYHEHEKAINLSLLGVVAIGAVALRGLRGVEPFAEESVAKGAEETVAERTTRLKFAARGTKEFEALRDGLRLINKGSARPLHDVHTICNGSIEKTGVLAAPSKGRWGQKWEITCPINAIAIDSVKSEHGMELFGDPQLKAFETPGKLYVGASRYGSFVLDRKTSTGKYFLPDGSLSLELNHHGDELSYDGKTVVRILRGAKRTFEPTSEPTKPFFW